MESLITVIMPLYNIKNYVKRAIDSVITQSYKNWELIIIDDYSNDGTWEILESYSDIRIKKIRNKENKGPAYSRNRGLKLAKGEYITFLDGDDYLDSDKFKSQIEFMKKNRYRMSHGNYYFVDVNGNRIKKVQVTEKIDYNLLLRGNQFKIMTMMIERESIGEKRFEIIKHEDYAFFLDILKDGVISYCDTERCDSFCTIGRVESISAGKLKSALWTWNIYRKHEKLGIIKSIYYFINYVVQGFKKYR